MTLDKYISSRSGMGARHASDQSAIDWVFTRQTANDVASAMKYLHENQVHDAWA